MESNRIWQGQQIVRFKCRIIPKLVLDESVFLIFLFKALVVCWRQLEAQPRGSEESMANLALLDLFDNGLQSSP